MQEYIKALEKDIADFEVEIKIKDLDRGMGGYPDSCGWLHDELKGMKRALELTKTFI